MHAKKVSRLFGSFSFIVILKSKEIKAVKKLEISEEGRGILLVA